MLTVRAEVTADELAAFEAELAILLNSLIVSGLTIMAWDWFEYLPEDVRLLFHQKIRVPTAVYFGARSPQFMGVAPTFYRMGPTAPMFIFTVHRGLVSLLLYFRVHALYLSNFLVRSVFILAMLAIIAVSLLYTEKSGVVSGGFDIMVFIAILYKLAWRSEVKEGVTEPKMRTSFWLPFKRNSHSKIADRFLWDSLFYVLWLLTPTSSLTIVVKIPQIMYFDIQIGSRWNMDTMYVDAVIVCVVACKIFRDMKLGLPGISGKAVSDGYQLSVAKPQSALAFGNRGANTINTSLFEHSSEA
ncbi:hypothetical protein CPB83DRAFT_838711 [Crepidotus variabilis]|uniref:Uncharacterized protein n=1 Tax=Crepidotus variabilis TaxID=179855 RepID=A0A9P6E987_9AGAR|nr:hypothetical protein CPB83DRAFT_838711 [Crepidotus variabilis]